MAHRQSEWLTPEEVAALLKITPKTVKDWLRAGKLPGRKMGKLWRVQAAEVDAFMEQLPREAPAAERLDATCPEVLLALVRAILPLGQGVHLRDKGVTELPLAELNAALAPLGFTVHAVKVGDPKRG